MRSTLYAHVVVLLWRLMTSTYSDAGFDFPSPKVMADFLAEKQGSSQSMPTPFGGRYGVYTDSVGRQLYAQYNPEDQLIGCNPHVVGKGVFRGSVAGALPSEQHPLDGGVLIQTIDDQPGVPLLIDTPNFRLHACFLEQGTEATFQITAFPLQRSSFSYAQDTESFAAGPYGKLAASSALIPSGLFRPGGERVDPPNPYAILVGPITEVALLPSDTGTATWRCEMKTLGGTVTLSAGKDLFPDEPRVGGIVAGMFYLSALLLEPLPTDPRNQKSSTDVGSGSSTPPKRSFLGRLMGRS